MINFTKYLAALFLIFTISAAQEEQENLTPLSPPGLFDSTDLSQAKHPLFVHWENTVNQLQKVLHENVTGTREVPCVFISHAWHIGSDGAPVHTPTLSPPLTRESAHYYDQFDLHLAKMLKNAGFVVHYDKDLSTNTGIMDEGAQSFMEKKVRDADIILSICTPLYCARASRISGVKIEVDRIKDRLCNQSQIGFYIPLLVAWDKSCSPNDLLVGQDLEKMQQAIYLDLRDKSTFISNMWQVLHRVWKNVQRKWEDDPKYDKGDPRSREIAQQYIKILGNLLSHEDYYTDQDQPVPSQNKDLLKRNYNSLRVFTTVTEDLKPDVVINLIKQEIDAHQDLFHASNGQHIVAFLGNTGAGKSTLVNFLAGKTLQIDEFGQSYQLTDENHTCMKIGDGADSQTLYPQSIRVNDILFFDFPGFNDTEGSIQNLVNAAFIRQILIEAASVRFVFVAGQDEMTAGRGEKIKRLFSAIRGAFPSPDVIENNSMLIVTKSYFQDLALGIKFWLKKMESSRGTEWQEQLRMWQRIERVAHLPHPQCHDITTHPIQRQTMLQALQRVEPTKQETIQGFNMSCFFPPEVNLPLRNMFYYVIQQHSQQILEQKHSLQRFIEESDIKAEDAAHKLEEYTSALDYYGSTNFWEQEFWPTWKSKLQEQREINLLKEICQDPYEQACQAFQRDEEKQQHLSLKSLAQKKHAYERYQIYKPHRALAIQNGYPDESFQCFLNGKLIYKPKVDSDEGKIEMRIADLVNPLESEFDLSACGDAGQYLSINTGYRKGQIPENANKVEIWFVPKFLVERDLNTTAGHFRDIMGQWTAPIGIFWTRGNWDNLGWYDYLVNEDPKILSNGNLYDKAAMYARSNRRTHGSSHDNMAVRWRMDSAVASSISCSFCELK